jgi:hypothetical protein
MGDLWAPVRRNPTLWSWRAFIIVICLVLGFLSSRAAIVASARSSNAELALRLDPDDPIALANAADQRIASSAASAPGQLRSRGRVISGLARHSLQGQAVNARAFKVLGYIAEIEKGPDAAERFMSMSSRMSRRELGTNLWLIERNVNKGDMKSVLAQYDVSLRSIADSRQILFPLLTSALEDTSIQAAFASYLKARPNWLAAFLSYAIGASDRPSDIAAALKRGGGMPKGDDFRGLDTYLLARLGAKAEFAAALQYYLEMPSARKTLPQSVLFDKASTDPRLAPVTWLIPGTGAFNVAFELPDKGSRQELRAFIPAGERGIAARKLMALPAGQYDFLDRRKDVQASDGELHWELRCVHGQDAPLIWSAPASGPHARPTGPHIPADCPIQLLDLVGSGGSGSAGLEVIIGEIRLDRRPGNTTGQTRT